jgi:hypothetical protein
MSAVSAGRETKQPQVWMNRQLHATSWPEVRHTELAAHETIRAEGPAAATRHTTLMLAGKPD